MANDKEARHDEPTLTTKLVYEGHVVRLEEHTVALPNGHTATREVVRHNGAVAVVAELADERLVLVEQFRKAPGKRLLELPAGKLEPGESLHACALRELREETGYVTDRVRRLYSFYTSPGFADEVISLFYATELREGVTQPDEDEFVDIHLFSRADVQTALDEGAFEDAKTLIGVLWWLSKPAAERAENVESVL